MNCIAYKAGFKYQLIKDAVFQTDIIPPQPIITEYISLDERGVLVIKEGYAWDGPSGPTKDRSTNMRGSLPHDAGYELMRKGYLDESIYRPQFDALLKKIWIEDGMHPWLAEVEVKLVSKFAASAGSPAERKVVIYAPKECI